MSRDCFPAAAGAGYPRLIELQPVAARPQARCSARGEALSYEMTSGAAPLTTLEPRKRRTDHYAEYESPASGSRRRKPSSFAASISYEEDSEDARSTRTLPDKKQNHSEIEKRRRDKMNTYISELAAMVPMCGAMARKLDKLTVLRLAVQHVRSVRGALATGPLAACPRPPYVPERELNELVLAAGSSAALLVVGCDRGRLLYVSRGAHAALHYTAPDLLGQSLFDILHPKDVAKVKEQLSSSELGPRERLIDAKTMLPLRTEAAAASRLCPGARRSFFCRIKCKTGAGGESDPSTSSAAGPSSPPAKMRKKAGERKYCVVQCTGYLKAWAAADETGSGEDEPAGPSCLVAVARALPDLAAEPPHPPARPLRFLSRHATDGKYLFVEQRVTLALGWLPQELLGTSLYEYVSSAQLAGVARAHKAALTRRAPLRSPPYAARCKDGSTALLQTHFKPFQNPWTKDVECLVAQHTLLVAETAPAPYAVEATGAGEATEGASDAEVQRLIDSQVESHKIGSAIAEEALRRSPTSSALDLPAELLHDALFADAEPVGSPAEPGLALDGNGEAAMAVIMSLLEADAGLGGPVNFSGLPWPLP